MKIAVIGATGVYGRHLVPRLVEAGHEVRASYRKDADVARIAALGAEAVQADILDAPSLDVAVKGCDAALHIATQIPGRRPGANWETNDRIRREGTANLIATCGAAGCERYLQQSVAMILCTGDDRPQTVDDPVDGQGPLESVVETEQLVRASGLDWRIVRGGGFYGPGTGMDDGWRAAAREGTLRVPGEGERFHSLIHVADMAAATLTILDSDATGSVWNVVDDEPVRAGVLFDYVAAVEGMPPPARGGPYGLRSFRVSNARLKSELGWRPAYPSFRSGLAA